MFPIALLALVLWVPVGGVFGEAVAEGSSTETGLISIEIEVEVPAATSVVAHIIDPGDGQTTLSMYPRTGGVFAVSAEVEQADLVVVFEVLDGQEVVMSRPVTLSELGVDPAALGAIVEPNLLEVETPTPEVGITPATRKNIWLAVALGASALALLAIWAAGPKLPEETGVGDDVARDSPEDARAT